MNDEYKTEIKTYLESEKNNIETALRGEMHLSHLGKDIPNVNLTKALDKINTVLQGISDKTIHKYTDIPDYVHNPNKLYN